MADINHTEALELISDDYDADKDNQEDALQDQKFRSGDQWAESERKARANRPCLTINEMNKFVDQVAGELRRAQVGIQVLPVDSREDKAIAGIYEGLIRQIEYQSHAMVAYGHGIENAVGCSTGNWRVLTQRTKDSPFQQEIKIDRILDPLSVIWDAQATGIVKEDALRCWVTSWIHKTAWERRFPVVSKTRNLEDVPIDSDPGGASSGLYWRRDDFVRIAEYWYTIFEDRTFVMLDTGQTLDITEVAPEEVQRLRFNGRIVNEAQQPAPQIRRRMMDGSDWLGDEEEWAGQFIPIVPVMGREIAFDGKVLRRSLIRDAKDSQKLQNFWRSAAAEAVGKQPKTPWQATPKQVAGLEDYYTAANVTDVPILPYNVDPDAPTAMPKRVDPPQLPQAMLQQSQLARDDMMEVTGIYKPQLGAPSNLVSGRAIIAQQREGDVATFVYSENFAAAMWRTGEILVDLIPRIYDTERQIRILQPDETEQYVPINVRVTSIDGEEILINDLSNRRFDVRVKVGASYTTARAEAEDRIANALQTNPALWSVIGDLLFRNSDHPGADEIADRLERTIPDAIKSDQPEQQQPDPIAQAVAQLNLALLQARVQGAEASAQKDFATAQKTIAQVPQVIAETEQTQVETDGQEVANEADMQALEAGQVQPV